MNLSLLQWLDARPSAYWIPALCMLAALIAWSLRKAWCEIRTTENPGSGRKGRWQDDIVFAGLVMLTLLAWRWPHVLYAYEYSPDESQQISGVITLKFHPLFWNAIDGGTAGPLNFYVLMPLHWLGLPLGYFSTRLTLILLLTGVVVALQRTVALACGPASARVFCLPAILFFSLAALYDFVSYSTEYVAILLVTASTLLTGRILVNLPTTAPTLRSLWPIGLMLGAVPWSKMQALPLGAIVGAAAVVGVLFAKSLSVPNRLRLISHLVAAALLPSVIALILIVLMGEWHHFYMSYIAYNRLYVGDRSAMLDVARALWINSQPDSLVFPAFATTTLFAGLAGTAAAFFMRRYRLVMALAFALVVGAFTAVLAPGRGFPHYLVLLIAPLTLWCAFGAALLNERARSFSPGGRLLFLLGTLTILTTPTLAVRLAKAVPHPWGYMSSVCGRVMSPISQAVLDNSRPGDHLAMWGWFPQVYVETKRPQATRDGHSQRQIEDKPLRDYYRQRYLEDLARTNPVVFVDAVGPDRFAFQDRTLFGHETFPELARYVSENFALHADIYGARIYLRTRVTETARLPGE